MINQCYFLGELIGSGRLSEVFAVEDMRQFSFEKSAKKIAIKLLRPEFLDCPAAIYSFETEYLLGASLSHDSLVRFYEFYTHPRKTFLVMERLDGQTFSQLRQQLISSSIKEKIQIFKKLLVALAFLHERQLTHADLKPSNIFITHEGCVKLIDLGLSTSVFRQSPDTAYAFSKYYSSPERRMGADPSFQDDIFAFACIAYEIFSGKYPFDKNKVDQYVYSLGSNFEKFEIDKEIKHWLFRALSLKPDIRPQDACYLISRLSHIF
jgi:serine/threonine protein kinase